MKRSNFFSITIIVLVLFALPLRGAISVSQRNALIALYNSTGGAGWTDNTNWNGAAGTEGTWFGITVVSDMVTRIDLNNNNLVGAISAEIGNLPGLTHLYLGQNQLNGTIPSQLGNLTQLDEIYLFGNQLSGAIPVSLGNLSNLRFLNISNNQLTGELPASLANLSKLESLKLSNNLLSGSIPGDFGNFAALKYIYLAENQLSGTIPFQLGNISTLRSLDLTNNRLEGNIPIQMGYLSALLYLHLGGNKLSGEIPAQLTNLTAIIGTGITLDYNLLYTENLALQSFLNNKDPNWAVTQTIAPASTSATPLSASSIRVSWIPIPYMAGPGGYIVFYSLDGGTSYTQYPVQTTDKSESSLDITGLVPGTQYSFVVQTRTEPHIDNPNDLYSGYSIVTMATTLAPTGIPAPQRAALIALYNSTNGNAWTDNTGWKTPPLEPDGFAAVGTENTWYGVGCDTGNTVVLTIDLYTNNLSGAIPAELGNLTNLTTLNLHGNDLSGSIPSAFGSLVNLKFIDLSYNQLSGNIPVEFGNLASLEELWMYHNQLSGSIPPGIGNLSQLEVIVIRTNQISGNIPPELGNLSNLLTLDFSFNQLTGPIPPQLGNLTSVYSLDFHQNLISGSIPAELGNLSNLTTLNFNRNQLSGAIPPEIGNLINLTRLDFVHNHLEGPLPAELGNLTNLNYLSIGSNRIIGEVPATFSNLTGLSSLDIIYNGVYTEDSTVKAFLDSKLLNWDARQTVAPKNVSISMTSDTSCEITWTPILYTDENGGYRIWYSKTSGGPYELFNTTADKTVSQLAVSGLDTGTQYFFAVQTRTDANPLNLNTVDSEYSQEVTITTAGAGTIMVLTPRKNDVYNVRTTISIAWNAPGFTGSVEIRLILTDESVSYLISGNQPVDAPLDYVVEKHIPKGIYFIEVRQNDIFDRSGHFYIDDQSDIYETDRK